MGSDRYLEVVAHAQTVSELLRRLDPRSLLLKPNPYEPTIAGSIALALLELDRIASEVRIESGPLPGFARDFLNRRLSRRLLERYHGQELPAEFERRLHDVIERLTNRRLVEKAGPALEQLHHLLIELEAALLQRHDSVDRNPER